MDNEENENSLAEQFSALKWTFTQRLQMPSLDDSARTALLFGSGPYINVYIERSDDNREICLEPKFPKLSVFEGIGEEVRGAASLANGHILVWGDTHIAHVTVNQLLIGGTVCQRNILSTGRLIVVIRTYDKPQAFTVYFADGTLQSIECKRNRRKHSMKVLKTCRVPLKPREMITAARVTSSSLTYLGTNLGRLAVLNKFFLMIITDPVVNSPIKQIVIMSAENTHRAVMRFQNGSIASRISNNRISEIKGRFTCLSDFSFDVHRKGDERNLFAGDMDGNVAVLQFDKGSLEIYRTITGLIFNEITVMERMDEMRNIAFGGNMGEVQMLNVSLLGISRSKYELPSCVVDSDCYYRIDPGWAFIKDDILFITPEMEKSRRKAAPKTMNYCKKDKIKLKYYCCTANPDREIILAYNKDGYQGHIIDYTQKVVDFGILSDKIEYRGTKLIVMKIIIMQSYIVYQTNTGRVQLVYIDSKRENQYNLFGVTLSEKITAAACIERFEPSVNNFLRPLDMMVGYLNGKVEVIPVAWNADGSLRKETTVYHYMVDLQGGFIVSMISSIANIGKEQAILLSNKGVAYLTAKSVEKIGAYSTTRQQDLRHIIGRGHSLLETSFGILAVGFKYHTLNVCKLAMEVTRPRTFTHILSVDTSSCRLPFTIIEQKEMRPGLCRGREITGQLLVSYQRKDRMKIEEIFYFNILDPTLSFNHTGIISHICVNSNVKGWPQFFYTGDTHGRLCIWILDNSTMTGQFYLNDFKLRGAVTGILDFGDYIAVPTSQGYLHLFQKNKSPTAQLVGRCRYGMGQKITCITAYGDFLLLFLKDGTVKQVKLNSSKFHLNNANEIVTTKEIANFPCPVKMAMCNKSEKYYITALGTDYICRRMQLLPLVNEILEMPWRISVIKKRELESLGTVILAGDPQGWFYILISNYLLGPTGYVDRIHKCEIIDVVHELIGDETLLISLDVSGIVVIRRFIEGIQTLKDRPTIWACPVPSPRKLTVIEHGRIMVVGKGIATTTF